MTTTTLPVLDSAEWMVNEFQDEILGNIEPGDEGYDALREAAIRFATWTLSLHWFHQGRMVTFMSAANYDLATSDDEAINVTASSFYLPSPEEALAVWQSVADSITPDEIRHFVGVS